ncbi:MAG TPA: inositol monophosphatase family protein [Jatrophihabitans sp.]|nr:inositol monophosphatase family protein [Jatrophihabitans sp.]
MTDEQYAPPAPPSPNGRPAAEDPLAADLALAVELVRGAGDLAAEMLAGGLRTHHKSSVSDVVSAADHAAEELVAGRLRAARPADGIVGEEGAAVPGDRTWFIDPVDGTYNFLAGLPFWCSALALAERTESGWAPLLGAVYHPAANELWAGSRTAPATRNGQPLPPLADRPLAEVSLSSYLHPAALGDPDVREPTLAAMTGAATVRMLGSGSVELAAVAGGRLGAYLHRDTLDWDWLPGAALVTAAGGRVEVFGHRGHRWHLAGSARAVGDLRQRILAV